MEAGPNFCGLSEYLNFSNKLVKLQCSLIYSAICKFSLNSLFFQLKDENDYYYTVFNQKKKAREDGIDLRKGRRFFFGEEESDDENEDKVI